VTAPATRWARIWPGAVGVIVVAAVGSPAAVASYRHARDVVQAVGDEVMAPWLPLSVDGMLVAALVVIWVRRHRGEPAGRGPWAAFTFGMVVTVAANLAAVVTPSVKAYAVALFPPIALAVTLELVAILAARPAVRVEAVPVGPVSLTGPVPVGLDGPADDAPAVPVPRDGDDAARTSSVEPVRRAPETGPADGQDDADEPGSPSDDELIAAVRAWAADEGTAPSRERIRVRFAIGSGRADRVRAAVLTGPGEEATA
jgi:hypothetical protein